MSETGRIQIVEGSASENPSLPSVDAQQILVLGHVNVPVFPTLAATQAESAQRPDYRVTYSDRQVRGYTMKDVGKIHESVKRLAQVTSLSTLEKAAADLDIPSAVDPSLTCSPSNTFGGTRPSKSLATPPTPNLIPFSLSFSQTLSK